jgi:hypothetical protein
VSGGVQGGWWQLLDIRKQAQEEFDFWADNPPMACPQCGEPLRNSPTADSGSSVELYCVFDGWQYPRDYIRPQRL